MARRSGLQFYKRRKKINSNLINEIGVWIIGIAMSVFLACFLTYAIGRRTNIIGNSMEPLLLSGQTIFVNQIQYNITKPHRGDVIVFLPNGNQNSHYYVKRVVGLPGETIRITNGKVFIDGVVIEESYDLISDAGIAENAIEIPSGEYFVLGDNRNSSEDSRSSNIGTIKANTILGKAWLRMPYKESIIGLVK